MVVIEVFFKGCVHQQLYKDENLAVKKAGFKFVVEVVFGDSTSQCDCVAIHFAVFWKYLKL